MNQPNSQTNWEKRLQELEAEVNETGGGKQETSIPESSPVTAESSEFSSQIKSITTQIRRWFDELPVLGKVVVGAIALGISLSLLKTVFQLITSVLTLAIIGALGYVGYQVFIKGKDNTND